jgi:hypothetical protein
MARAGSDGSTPSAAGPSAASNTGQGASAGSDASMQHSGPPGGDTDPNAKPSGFLDSTLNILDPGGARKQISNLFNGGAKGSKNAKAPDVYKLPANKQAIVHDWRVKLSLPAGSGLSYSQDNPLLSILGRTGGMVFPYTPSITVTHNARYQEQSLTHSNYKYYFYEGSDVAAINIVGDFTVQNKDEALYWLASVYFLRSCTKMFFGADPQDLAGNPPPIIYLDGYGDYYFPHVSCVVTSFQHTMPADVDYMEVTYDNSKLTGKYPPTTGNQQKVTRVPTMSQFNVTVQPVYSRSNVANNMSLTQFSRGALINGKGGFL